MAYFEGIFSDGKQSDNYQDRLVGKPLRGMDLMMCKTAICITCGIQDEGKICIIKLIVAGPQRVAGYEDIIDDAVLELERMNGKIAAAKSQYQMLQSFIEQAERQALALRDSAWQVHIETQRLSSMSRTIMLTDHIRSAIQHSLISKEFDEGCPFKMTFFTALYTVGCM